MGEEKKPNTDDLEKGVGQKVDMKKEILSWVFYIAFVLVLTWVIITFVGQRTRVDGRSMMNTLHDGDNLIVEKLSYRFSDPKRFDIIVFPPTGKKEYYIKRIIGLPGETVQIDENGNIYINGELLEENYGAETIQNPGRAAKPITLGDDEYFVMGDNRNNSKDSRSEEVGNVKRSQIIGRAWLRIWPLNKFGLLKHQ
ncbi:MAG: signal peptidase I [Lachnospiraceae bacterium]